MQKAANTSILVVVSLAVEKNCILPYASAVC